MGSGLFSKTQWQELEVQALIYRHLLAGASIPPDLLHPYYLHHSSLEPPYWGRGALDPEPRRCRRTDGKKWRCTREAALGHKYCHRHLHRGRSRLRKPVEAPTTPPAAAAATFASSGSAALSPEAPPPLVGAPFGLSWPPPLNPDPRSSPPPTICRPHSGAENDIPCSGRISEGQVLRCFFDDWPESNQETDHPPSDTSLKLFTGGAAEAGARRRQPGPSWAAEGRACSMGGPLAEALRSLSVPTSPSRRR